MCRSVKMYPACGLVVWRCWARGSLASCEVNIPDVLVNKLQCKVLLTKVTVTMPDSLGEDRSHISSKSPGDRDQVPVLRAVPSGEQREPLFLNSTREDTYGRLWLGDPTIHWTQEARLWPHTQHSIPGCP